MLRCKGGDFTESTAGWLDERAAMSTIRRRGSRTSTMATSTMTIRPTTNGFAPCAVACRRLRQGAGVSGRRWNRSFGRRPLDMTTTEELYSFANLWHEYRLRRRIDIQLRYQQFAPSPN